MNGEALPHGLGTPFHWGIPTVIEVFSHPLVGGSSTWLNMVTGDGQWLSMGPSILRPSNMSCVVMVMNSPMAQPILLHSLPKGELPGLLADKPFLPNAENTSSRLQ